MEILRKQVDHLRAQVEESKAAAPPADVTDLTADLTAARKRITELEDQLRTSASPAAVPAAAGAALGASNLHAEALVQQLPKSA